MNPRNNKCEIYKKGRFEMDYKPVYKSVRKINKCKAPGCNRTIEKRYIFCFAHRDYKICQSPQCGRAFKSDYPDLYCKNCYLGNNWKIR